MEKDLDKDSLDIDLEEDIVSDNKPMDKFNEFICILQDIVIEDEFTDIRNNFFEKYYNQFDEKTEENKLEHYDIFKEYVSTIEGYLEKVGYLN